MNKIAPITPFLDDYATAVDALPGAAHPRISGKRSAGVAAYRKDGLPIKKVEAWRYTRLKDLESGGYIRATQAAEVADIPYVVQGDNVLRVVLVDGFYVPDLSDTSKIDGFRIRDLKTCLKDGSDRIISKIDKSATIDGAPLAALASAYLNDGVVLQVDAGVQVAPIVEVVTFSTVSDTPILSFPRVIVTMDEGSSLTLVENFCGQAGGAYALSAVTDVDLAPKTNFKHYVLQAQTDAATHVFTSRCDVPEGASYEGFALQIGGKTARHEAHLRMVGLNSEAKMNGAYGIRGTSHCDTTTVIDHVSPETNTDQVFKGILDDTARGVYQGRVHVHRDAQQINGNQLHNAMLLSRKAQVNCKPELEIYADDVKCSHGATVGELDAAQVFYLRSRGVDEMTARALLVQAFLGEALELISDETVREAFTAKADEWFVAGQSKQ